MNKYWMIVCAAAVFAGAAPVFAETVTGEVVDLFLGGLTREEWLRLRQAI